MGRGAATGAFLSSAPLSPANRHGTALFAASRGLRANPPAS